MCRRSGRSRCSLNPRFRYVRITRVVPTDPVDSASVGVVIGSAPPHSAVEMSAPPASSTVVSGTVVTNPPSGPVVRGAVVASNPSAA